MMDIQDTHPLRELITVENIAPFLGLCFKKKKSNFKAELRQALLKDLGVKIPKNETQISQDPYLILGYGINAYFDILLSLSAMFVCISLICIPIFLIYSSGQAYSQQKSFIISKFTLGNLGGSQIVCDQTKIWKKKAEISCPVGTYLDTDFVELGIMSMNLPSKSHCTQHSVDQEIIEDPSMNYVNCSAHMDYDRVKQMFR